MIDIEKRLKRLPYTNIKIKSLHREIIGLSSGTLKGQSFDGMPKSPTNDNRTEDMNIKVVDRVNELYKKIEEIYKEQQELTKWIESLEDPIENMVMRLLYIDGLSWDKVRIQLRCGRSTIKRVRRSALKKWH